MQSLGEPGADELALAALDNAASVIECDKDLHSIVDVAWVLAARVPGLGSRVAALATTPAFARTPRRSSTRLLRDDHFGQCSSSFLPTHSRHKVVARGSFPQLPSERTLVHVDVVVCGASCSLRPLGSPSKSRR